MKINKAESGFTFVEIGVVLTIIAVLVGGGIMAGSTVTETAKVVDTQNRLASIAEILTEYQKVNGVIPCPASLTDAITASTFGVSGDCDTGTVTHGALPVRSLGLAANLMFDSWDNRLLYVVTNVHTTTAEAYDALSAVGLVEIRGGSGTNSLLVDSAGADEKASFVLLSHGKDGKGAYSKKEGTLLKACGSSSIIIDEENCDGDDIFISTVFNNGDVAANFFDDYIVYGAKVIDAVFVEGAPEGGEGGGSGVSRLFFSTVSTNGDVGGYINMHALCDDEAETVAARFAHKDDLGSIDVGLISEDVWVGQIGHTGSSQTEYSCAGYGRSTSSYQGLVLQIGGTYTTSGCDVSRKVACWNLDE